MVLWDIAKASLSMCAACSKDMHMGWTWPSSIWENILERPDMASMVMRSSGSSRSSIPASMALRMVVEKWDTWRRGVDGSEHCLHCEIELHKVIMSLQEVHV